MSDYKPITGELRKYATVTWDPWPDARDRLYQMCDRIDSIHAGLEREYAATLAEREGDWIKLPVDADGLPIRIGDVMVGEKVGGGYCEPFKVIGYVANDGVIEPMDEHKLPRVPRYAHHHVPDTWERIIEDALDGYHDTDFDKLVARCKKLAGEAE